MKFLGKLRKKSEGFTLVELIVVLVILAILAAFTIPAMLGFVNDARQKAAIAQQREVYVAAQSIATEMYTTKGFDGTDLGTALGSNAVAGTKVENPTTPTEVTTDKMRTYIGTDIKPSTTAGDGAGNTALWTVEVSGGKVTKVTFRTNGKDMTPLTFPS